jgi:uncharacterized protein YkwD
MRTFLFFLVSIIFLSCAKPNFNDEKFKEQALELPIENPNKEVLATKKSPQLQSYEQKLYPSFKREKLLQVINYVREKAPFCSTPQKKLQWNYHLEKAAMAHAKDVALHHLKSSTGSGTSTDLARKANGVGSHLMQRLLFFGYPVKTNDLVAENIIISKKRKHETIEQNFKRTLFYALKKAPYCKILMHPRFKDIGVGVYKKRNRYYWVIVVAETDK